MTLLSIILLALPLLYHLWNDKDGEEPEDKGIDILIMSVIAIAAAVAGFFIADKPIIDGLFLSWAIHFAVFDYAINYILYRHGVIENLDWFSHLGKSYTDDVLRQWKPWTRFWIKVGILVVAVTIYIL